MYVSKESAIVSEKDDDSEYDFLPENDYLPEIDFPIEIDNTQATQTGPSLSNKKSNEDTNKRKIISNSQTTTPPSNANGSQPPQAGAPQQPSVSAPQQPQPQPPPASGKWSFFSHRSNFFKIIVNRMQFSC